MKFEAFDTGIISVLYKEAGFVQTHLWMWKTLQFISVKKHLRAMSFWKQLDSECSRLISVLARVCLCVKSTQCGLIQNTFKDLNGNTGVWRGLHPYATPCSLPSLTLIYRFDENGAWLQRLKFVLHFSSFKFSVTCVGQFTVDPTFHSEL